MGTKKRPTEELFADFSDPQIRPAILWERKWPIFLPKFSDLENQTHFRPPSLEVENVDSLTSRRYCPIHDLISKSTPLYNTHSKIQPHTTAQESVPERYTAQTPSHEQQHKHDLSAPREPERP